LFSPYGPPVGVTFAARKDLLHLVV